MRIFSPSSTILWKRCPQEYAYYKSGIVPRALGPINYGALFGSAMSVAMNCIHGKGNKADPLLCADSFVTSSCAEFDSLEIKVDFEKIDSILKLLPATIQRYNEAWPDLFARRGWKVRESEWTIPDSGNSRVDLLLVDEHDTPIILDAKWKKEVKKAEYEQSAIDSYQHDWKMKHYCFFTGHALNKHPILDYYIMLGIASPKFKLNIIPYSISVQELREWEISAKQAWHDMDDSLRPITHTENCRDQYGLCPYYDLHFTYNGDYINAGSLQYVKIDRKEVK